MNLAVGLRRPSIAPRSRSTSPTAAPPARPPSAPCTPRRSPGRRTHTDGVGQPGDLSADRKRIGACSVRSSRSRAWVHLDRPASMADRNTADVTEPVLDGGRGHRPPCRLVDGLRDLKRGHLGNPFLDRGTVNRCDRPSRPLRLNMLRQHRLVTGHRLGLQANRLSQPLVAHAPNVLRPRFGSTYSPGAEVGRHLVEPRLRSILRANAGRAAFRRGRCTAAATCRSAAWRCSFSWLPLRVRRSLVVHGRSRNSPPDRPDGDSVRIGGE